MKNNISKLGEVLLENGMIKEEQLIQALAEQSQDNRKLGEVLVQKGWISDEKLSQTLAGIFEIPFVRLSDVVVDPKVFEILPQDLIQDYKVFPVSVEGNILTVATNNPLDVSALQDIQYKSGMTVVPAMASRSDIDRHLQEYADSLLNISARRSAGQKEQQGATIIKLVESIFQKAIKERASDIHFEPMKDGMRVRFRIDGVLYERSYIEKSLQRNVVSRIKIISGMDVAESRRPQDGRTSFVYEGREFDIRVSSLCNLNGENLVLRLLEKQYVRWKFEDLGMDEDEISLMYELIKRPYGLILITGPTGAGKTTTLYSILRELNQKDRHIVSVEDPIEYEIEGVNQTAINKHLGYTFDTAMRNILRHDPDIIMLGEIRDVQTAEAAVRAALTGHLVISTMHTNSACGAVIRLLEMNIEPFLVSSSLIGVVAQRLVRRLCPHCKESYVPSEDIFSKVKGFKVKPGQKFSRAVGCDQCLQTGYSGRLGIFEMMKTNEEIREMILKCASEAELSAHAVKAGMNTLRMAGIKKAANQQASLEEALRITSID